MAASPTTSISFQNFFSATLTGDITATSTDILLDTVPNGSEGFLVIDPDSTTAREVIYYNSKTATKVVCPSVADGRGQDDTTAGAHLTGTTVIMAPVAAYFETLLSLFTTSPQGWTALSGTFTSPTANGNRSYDISTSADQSAILTPGMRLRTSRTVAAPTQCTDLESGSSQYYSKASPNGMTFTDDFVVSAWVKLESYGAGVIASRYDGTSGWILAANASGQVTLFGYNGGAGNNSGVTSYQSLPLNKWIHVTAQLDMSAFTATTTTSYVMLDGVDVPSSVTRAGTNPTALVQAGNLNIGAQAGAVFFDGKLAQVAIYSAKVTQATIKASMNQTLSGSETSLISAYSFNNSINDLNANANNLTANGSAVATNADSPFTQNANGTPGGTYDYAIITKVTASTLTVQVPEGCAIPTSGGISAAYYSTFKAPFGMPVDAGKWRVSTIHRVQVATTSNANFGNYNSGGNAITVPVGAWNVGYNFVFFASTVETTYCLSPTSLVGVAVGSEDINFSTRAMSVSAGNSLCRAYLYRPQSLSSASTYVIYTQGATTSSGIDADNNLAELFAEFNLL